MAKIRVKTITGGDPVPASTDNNMVLSPGKTTPELGFDLRDRLAELAVKGHMLKPDDKAAMLSYLTSTLGQDKAQKLMTHAYIFNQRPDVQNLSPEEKIRSFYTIGSNDPDIQDVITKTKNLGYGPVQGFHTSVSNLNQEIQKGTYGNATTAVSPEVQKKVMIRVAK